MTKPLIHPQAAPHVAALIATPPQSLIIAGESGIGSATVAYWMARQTGTLLTAVRPTKRQSSGSFAIDLEAGSIRGDDIRELYTITRSSFRTPHIVVIESNGQPFSHTAQNAFLKLLEQPPPNISFILAVHTIDELLPTIQSRCALLVLPPITARQTESHLETLAVTDSTIRARLLFMAQGKPAELSRLATDTDRYDARVATMQLARQTLQASAYERLTIISKLKDNRQGALQLIDDMIKQLEISLAAAPQPHIIATMIDALLEARQRIERYGNIPLQLAAALLP